MCECMEGYKEYQGKCIECYYYQGDCYLDCPKNT